MTDIWTIYCFCGKKIWWRNHKWTHFLYVRAVLPITLLSNCLLVSFLKNMISLFELVRGHTYLQISWCWPICSVAKRLINAGDYSIAFHLCRVYRQIHTHIHSVNRVSLRKPNIAPSASFATLGTHLPSPFKLSSWIMDVCPAASTPKL